MSEESTSLASGLLGTISKVKESLLKASKGDAAGKGDDDDEDYKPEYMKKHLQKFMKDESNADYMKKCLKESATLQKALVGSIPEIRDENATILEGTDFFRSFINFSDKMLQSVQAIAAQQNALETLVASQLDISLQSGEVLAKASQILEKSGATPNSLQAQVVSQQGAAAGTGAQLTGGAANAANELLTKAAAYNGNAIANKLFHLSTAGGQKELQPLVAKFDAAGRNCALLNKAEVETILGLMAS